MCVWGMLYRVCLYELLENRVLSLKCALVKKAMRSCSCKQSIGFLKKNALLISAKRLTKRTHKFLLSLLGQMFVLVD